MPPPGTQVARRPAPRRIRPPIARWLLLVACGWLAYGSTRALGSVIFLGAPWHDWQWYAALLALAAVVTGHVARLFPRSRLTRLALGGVTLWLVAGFNGFDQTIELDPARAARLSISVWANAGITRLQPGLIDDIRDAGGYVYLNIVDESLSGEARIALVDELRRLAEHDVEAYLVALASNYVSVPVHQEWTALVRKAARFVSEENLANVRGVIGDAEPPFKIPMDFLGRDAAGFAGAVRGLDDLVRSMKREYPDIEIGVTATGPQFLDRLDGDSDLALILRSPVDVPTSWTYVNMMSYSSYLPEPWQPYFIYLATRAMPRLVPDPRPSYLIGIVGSPAEPELGFDALVRDARMSRAMGAAEVVVFRLDGALEEFGDDFVRRLTTRVNETGAPIRVTFSRPVSLLLYGLALADSLLDVRGWPGLLVLGWALVSGFWLGLTSSGPEAPIF